LWPNESVEKVYFSNQSLYSVEIFLPTSLSPVPIWFVLFVQFVRL
jgi:hypothetical protein